MKVEARKEFGLRGWTVRIDGVFVADFYREVSARRLAMILTAILDQQARAST
jgi:hypothetical protein